MSRPDNDDDGARADPPPGPGAAPDHRLRFDDPARVWTEALPLGNGRLGAMCFGDPGRDRFALNHHAWWSGSPDARRRGAVIAPEDAAGALAAARAALSQGDYDDADRAVRGLQGHYSQAFLPLGDLLIETAGAGELAARELDFVRAVHATQALDGAARRSYVSAPDDVLVVESDFPKPSDVVVSFTHQMREIARSVAGRGSATGEAGASSSSSSGSLRVHLRAPSDAAPWHEEADPAVSWDAGPGSAVEGVVAISVVTDGQVTERAGALHVAGATWLRLLLACETTFRGVGQPLERDAQAAGERVARTLAAAAARPPEQLRQRHETEHAESYDRFELTLPARDGAGADEGTTPRLALARRSGEPMVADPALAALLLHYGRYLLLASSRPGSLPANLQGLWNADPRPPWSSNYTLNINTQMNYWGAESAGLGQCHAALAEFVVAGLAPGGRETAARLYGTRGWVAHHNSDAWALTSPVGQGAASPAWAFWPMAGPWLVRHLLERVRFAPTAARARELADEAWPALTGALAFLRDWVVELAPGVWGTPLATSPENTFRAVAGDRGSREVAVARHAAMDAELCLDVAAGVLEALDLVAPGLPAQEVAAARDDALWLLANVARPGLGRDGGVAEWYDDEEPADPHHRHVSMLYGAFPGDRDLSEAEVAAVGRSLDLRGDDSTGWSLVWKLALRARLRQGGRVADLLALLARDASRGADGGADGGAGEHRGGLYPNLFAAHPPFQIDGNLGFVGAAIECLVQSHRRVAGVRLIDVLPALPPAWHTGTVRGVRTRGGLVLDLTWAQGRPARLLLRADPAQSEDTTVLVRGCGADWSLTLGPGEAHEWVAQECANSSPSGSAGGESPSAS